MSGSVCNLWVVVLGGAALQKREAKEARENKRLEKVALQVRAGPGGAGGGGGVT